MIQNEWKSIILDELYKILSQIGATKYQILIFEILFLSPHWSTVHCSEFTGQKTAKFILCGMARMRILKIRHSLIAELNINRPIKMKKTLITLFFLYSSYYLWCTTVCIIVECRH